MAEKLLESLARLEESTKSVEEKIRKGREETKEELIKRIEESKAELQVKKCSFIIHVEAMNTKEGDALDFYKTSLNQKADHLKAEVNSKNDHIHVNPEEKKHELNSASAERSYNDSVEYAKSCVDWDLIALAEVENATLEAFSARIQLEDLNEPYN